MNGSHAKDGALIHLDEQALAPIRQLYHQGRYLDAYRLSEEIGPLRRWRGAAARLLAGRLASNLGGSQLGHVLRNLAFREHPGDLHAIYYKAMSLSASRGLLGAIEFHLAHSDEMQRADDALRAQWHALEATLFAHLRDWESTEAAMQRALACDPTGCWVRLEHAQILAQRDRYQESLDAVDLILEDRAWYRPAIQQRAYLLQLLGRDDEAQALLREAVERLQCYWIADQLLGMALETEAYHEVETLIERLEILGPCADRRSRRRINMARLELATHRQEFAQAIVHARAINLPFFSTVAGNIESCGEDSARVRLAVPFVRQHHMTCGPATLDALCRFFGVEARQPQIIEEIWFDGTTDFRERRWAERAGLVAREFLLTWDAARALIDAGIPFALATVETSSAHLQAVIGYDAARRTLLIRDPTRPEYQEFLVEQMLEHYASSGPRAMLLVPEQWARRIKELPLPEEQLYTRLYRLRSALDEHQRHAAQQVLDAMQEASPEARLTLQARRTLAYYDGDEDQALHATDALIERYPDDMRLIFARQHALLRLGRKEECEACLARACAGASPDLALLAAYCDLLVEDWRNRERVETMLRNLLRRAPYEPEHYLQLAGMRWRAAAFDSALMLYRVAACLAELNTRYVRSFFDAARLRNRTDEALQFLRARFDAFGHLSASPALSLIYALDVSERSKELTHAIQRALERRPDDPELLVELADHAMRAGRRSEAHSYLQRVQGRVQSTRWLHAAARLAHADGDLVGALAHYRRVLDSAPMDMNAIRGVTHTLSRTEGSPAALAFLRQWLQRFPQNLELLTLYVEEVATEPVDTRLEAVDLLLGHHPANTWARRERALILGDADCFEEAEAEVSESIALAPMESNNYSVAGALALRQGHLQRARGHFSKAIAHDADNANALAELIAISPDAASLGETTALIEEEFERQVLNGDGLLAYQRSAATALEPETLLASLLRAHEARPDLWQAWVALGEQQIASGKVSDALATLKQAAERFSSHPRVLVSLAAAHRHAGDRAAVETALQQALTINPSYLQAVISLADHEEMHGELGRAREVVERALSRDPMNSRYHGYLADYLWKDGDKQLAVQHIKRCAELDPDYDWAWESLTAWSAECGQPELPEAVARERIAQSPGEARSYLLLARMQSDDAQRLSLIDQALRKQPSHLDAHRERIGTLCRLGRHDEVEAAAQLALWHGRPPAEIRELIAWAHHDRGDTQAALAAAQALVGSDPHYFAGWKLLADLRCERGENEEYLSAARRLCELRPRDTVALGYLGEAALRCEQGDLARDSFEAAVVVSPGYMFAQSYRFDLAMDREDYETAEAALESFAVHAHAASHAYREACLATQRDDTQRAMKALRALLFVDGDEAWMLRDAITKISGKWGYAGVYRALRERLEDDPASASRGVGRHWADGVKDFGVWHDELPFLERLMEQGPAGLGAAISYLEALCTEGDPALIDGFVNTHGVRLRADPEAWATVTNTYRERGFAQTACDWAESWEQREDLGGWELAQVALACWDCRRGEQAVAAHERALAAELDATADWHRIWYALGSGLQGNHAACAQALDEVEEQDQGAYPSAVRALAAALRVALDPAHEPSATMQAAGAAFRAARRLYRPIADDTLRWLAVQTRTAILNRHPGPLWRGLLMRARMLV